MYLSVFGAYVGNMHHAGRFREKMRKLYDIYKEGFKAPELQSDPALQKKVDDTISNERVKVEGLVKDLRLPKGSLKLYDEITADMMRH